MSNEVKIQEKAEAPKVSKSKRHLLSSNKIIVSICITAMMLALAVVLDKLTSFIPFFNMPQGGHITLSLLPLIIMCLMTGPVYGLIGCFIFGFLNFLIDGGAVISGWSFLLDYALAFGCIGFTGFFHPLVYSKKNRWVYFVAIILGSLSRYIWSGLSGAILFGEYAPEGVNAWFYSFVLYNLPYLGISLVATAVFIIPLIKPVELVLNSSNFTSLKPRNLMK